jgi:hypothetical protein
LYNYEKYNCSTITSEKRSIMLSGLYKKSLRKSGLRSLADVIGIAEYTVVPAFRTIAATTAVISD